MERDQKLSSLFKESGLAFAPGDFTDKVMAQIPTSPVKSNYKPLIGRSGKILIILFIIGVALLSVFYSEPGGRLFDNVKGLSIAEWNLPQITLSMDLFSSINLSSWLVSTVVAIFLLLLLDTVLNRRKRMV